MAIVEVAEPQVEALPNMYEAGTAGYSEENQKRIKTVDLGASALSTGADVEEVVSEAAFKSVEQIDVEARKSHVENKKNELHANYLSPKNMAEEDLRKLGISEEGIEEYRRTGKITLDSPRLEARGITFTANEILRMWDIAVSSKIGPDILLYFFCPDEMKPKEGG